MKIKTTAFRSGNFLRHGAWVWIIFLCLFVACKRTESQTSATADTVAVSQPPAPTAPSGPLTVDPEAPAYRQELQRALKALSEKPNYAVLHSVKAIDLFSYLSAHYPSGHPFPVIYLDPQAGRLIVTHKKFQQSFPATQLDPALDAYMNQLVEHGYTLHGKTKKVELSLHELFPDETATQSHFTAPQYTFLRDELTPFSGFAYLSGLEPTGRDFPLMVGTGYEASARISIMGKDIAQEMTFEYVDSAFAVYRKYIASRLGLEDGD
jgi:hypothetical protein